MDKARRVEYEITVSFVLHPNEDETALIQQLVLSISSQLSGRHQAIHANRKSEREVHSHAHWRNKLTEHRSFDQ